MGVACFQKRTRGDETEKRYVMEVPSAGSLNGAVFMRKFMERDRFVVVWGGTATPHCGAMKIREKGWMLISEVRTPLGPVSHVRTCFQAFVVPQDCGTQASAVDITSQLVLNERCLRAQSDFQLIQSVILEEAGKKKALVTVT